MSEKFKGGHEDSGSSGKRKYSELYPAPYTGFPEAKEGVGLDDEAVKAGAEARKYQKEVGEAHIKSFLAERHALEVRLKADEAKAAHIESNKLSGPESGYQSAEGIREQIEKMKLALENGYPDDPESVRLRGYRLILESYLWLVGDTYDEENKVNGVVYAPPGANLKRGGWVAQETGSQEKVTWKEARSVAEKEAKRKGVAARMALVRDLK